MRLCYQQYLKYRGAPSIATVQRWQPYYNVCFDFLYNFYPEKILILRRSERDIITNAHRFTSEVPVIVVRL